MQTVDANPRILIVDWHYPKPYHIRSDNGPEFTTTAVRTWLRRIGVIGPDQELASPLGSL
jgi:hypothetical protein